MKCALVSIVILATSLFLFVGCKKDNTSTPAPVYSIQGLWEGTYSVDGQPQLGQQELNLVIKTDGTMVNDSKAGPQQHISLGTWTLTGDTAFVSTATCVYGYPQAIGAIQMHSGKFNKTTGKLTLGTWTNLNHVAGSGTFVLTKIN